MDLQELLNKWNIKCDINVLLSMWNESHRYYHNLNHLNDLIEQINNDKDIYSEKEYEKLLIAALFHDAIYDTNRFDNEEKSAEFFMNCCVEKNSDIEHINKIILDTKSHLPSDNLSECFSNYDMNIVERSYEQLLEWENNINLEYKQFGDLYKENRIKFLESIVDKYPNNSYNLTKLISYIQNS
jgi:pantetheine-phosphate adenylyltransferase